MLIPPIYIVVATALAGLAWILYARSQRGRKQAGVLGWLSLPFFALSCIYTWFEAFDVRVDIRAMHARYGIMSIAVTQAIILSILAISSRGKHGK